MKLTIPVSGFLQVPTSHAKMKLKSPEPGMDFSDISSGNVRLSENKQKAKHKQQPLCSEGTDKTTFKIAGDSFQKELVYKWNSKELIGLI